MLCRVQRSRLRIVCMVPHFSIFVPRCIPVHTRIRNFISYLTIIIGSYCSQMDEHRPSRAVPALYASFRTSAFLFRIVYQFVIRITNSVLYLTIGNRNRNVRIRNIATTLQRKAFRIRYIPRSAPLIAYTGIGASTRGVSTERSAYVFHASK